MKILKTAALVVGAGALILSGVGAIGGVGALASVGGAIGLGGSLTMATVTAVGTIAGLASTALNAISPPKAAKGSVGGSQTDFKLDPNAGIPYHVGRTFNGGNVVHRETWGQDNQNQGFVVTYSGAGTFQAFESYLVNLQNYGFVGDMVGGTYRNWLWNRLRLPSQPGAPITSPVAGFPGLDDAFRMAGHATGVPVFKFDKKEGKKFSGGIPRNGIVGIGERVYDPRQDSTYPGGAGPCRPNDEATYVGGAAALNPWCHALTFALGRYQNGRRVLGVGQRFSSIDVQAFVDAANVADANGWTLGGVIYSIDDKWEVLRMMAQAGGGRCLRLGARLSCVVNSPKVALANITERDLVGRASVSASQTYRERLNGFVPKYRSEQHGWEMVPASVVRVQSYVEADGEEKTREWPLPMVQSVKQAGELSAYELVNRREFGPITLPVFMKFMGYKPGDAVNLQIDKLGLVDQMAIIRRRQINPMTGDVQFSLVSETPEKHPYALGHTSTPPPIPNLTVPDESIVYAPQASDWSVDGGELEHNGIKTPAVFLSGDVRNPNASHFVVEIRPADGATWTAVGTFDNSVTKVSIVQVAARASYYIGVSYVVRGVTGERLQLGPALAGVSFAAGAGGIPDFGVIGGTIDPDTGLIVGGKPANEVIVELGEVQRSIDELIEVYGDTIAADEARRAAEAASAAVEVARTATESARDEAEQQALNSAGYAVSSFNFSVNASGAARQSEQSANDAGARAAESSASAALALTRAGSASRSAGEALQSEQNAAGSANLAATYSELSATTLSDTGKVMAAMFPRTPTRAAFTNQPDTGSGLNEPIPANEFDEARRVIVKDSNNSTGIAYPWGVWTRASLPFVPGKTYRITYVAEWVAGYPNQPCAIVYANFYRADGSHYTAYTISGGVGAPLPANQQVTRTTEFFCVDDPQAAFVRFGVLTGRDPNAHGATFAGRTDIHAFYVDDITSEKRSRDAATAAVTSAATAAASATEAGQQATAARTDRVAAEVAEGASTASAEASQSSAASASASAAAALTSATLSSRVTVGALNANPFFVAPGWPGNVGDLNNPPPGYTIAANDGAPYIGKFNQASAFGAPFCLQIDRNGLQSHIHTPVVPESAGWYVMEATVCIQDGTWLGAGLHVNFNNGYEGRLGFGTDPDVNGSTFGGQAHVWRSFSKMVQTPTYPVPNSAFYLMAGWTGFADPGTYSQFARTIWQRAAIRPATQGEIDGRKGALDAATAIANVVSEAATRANQDGALATRIDGTSTRIGTLEGSTAIIQTSLATVEGQLANRIQLQATGPGGRAEVSIYSSSNGGAGVDIVGDTRFRGKLAVGLTESGPRVEITDTRILFDNGVVMSVQGLGFGTSNQFLEWVGPKKADVSQCSESDAIRYVKVDGSAYFGGSLNAGVITNAVRTTSTAANAAVTTGPIGSNGRARVVTVSLYAYGTVAMTSLCPANPAPSRARVQLFRGQDGTGALLVDREFEGSYQCYDGFGPGEPGNATNQINGSFSFTDNSGGTSTAYYVRIFSRNGEVGYQTQILSLASVEQ